MGFSLIAVTHPGIVQGEAFLIIELLEMGISRVHIRKPSWTEEQVSSLLSAIPEEMHSRLTLHQTPTLLDRFPRIGFQLNSRHPQVETTNGGLLSVSCHTMTEAIRASQDERIAYQTLSPVYDSISKPGYHSAFTASDWIGLPPNTIALGGVTADKIDELAAYGFSGAAMLGEIWRLLEEGRKGRGTLRAAIESCSA